MSRSSKDDWICSDPKDKCNRCGLDQTCVSHRKSSFEIGKHMADKSKGLFSSDDWNCRGCGNVNWSKRSTCNVCNYPKFDVQGARTGYGGGYMERDEVVEYRERQDSDDDFDEFGRKKKTKSRGSKPTDYLNRSKVNYDPKSNTGDNSKNGDNNEKNLYKNHSTNLTTTINDCDDGDVDTAVAADEEEESGDEADLSKYDIWGADDDNKQANVKDLHDNKPLSNLSSDKKVPRGYHSPSSSTASESDDSDSSSSSSSSTSSHGSRARSQSSLSSNGPSRAKIRKPDSIGRTEKE